MTKYILDELEGSYEELELGQKRICGVWRTPPMFSQRNRIVKVFYEGNTFICEYNLDSTIQPGLEHRMVNNYGSEVARIKIGGDLKEQLIFDDKKYQIRNDRENNIISFLEDDRCVAEIKNYPPYKDLAKLRKHKGKCEVVIDEKHIEKNKLGLFSSIVAAYPSFRITW